MIPTMSTTTAAISAVSVATMNMTSSPSSNTPLNATTKANQSRPRRAPYGRAARRRLFLAEDGLVSRAATG